MAGSFKKKMLDVIGWDSEDTQPETIEEYSQHNEEEAPVRRDSYRSSRDEATSQRYDRYDADYSDRNARSSFSAADYGYDAGNYEQEEEYHRPSYERGGASSSTQPRHRMMIYQLTNYEDSRDVIDDLLEDRSVLINLENLGIDEAQRIIDTLIGACYAINATIKRAAQQTYLLAPASVEIAGTYADDGKTRSIF